MKRHHIIPIEILELIIAKAKGQLTTHGCRRLDEYLEKHPYAQAELNEYEAIARQARQLGWIGKSDTQRAWRTISKKAQAARHRSLFARHWMKVAAVMLPLMVALGLFYVLRTTQQEEVQVAEVMQAVRQSRATLVLASGDELVLDGTRAGQLIEREGVRMMKETADRISYDDVQQAGMHSLRVPRGGEYQLVLPDGTQVYINSGSQLDYPTVFDSEARMVSLSGEAYFVVAHDAERPFIVDGPDMKVIVTGTIFNLYDYPGDVAETTLVEGGLRVSSDTSGEIVLEPGQQARREAGDDRIYVREVDADLYTAWVKGFFQFRNMPLKDLARRMERWYDVDVAFADSAAEGIRLTGAMDKHKPFGDLAWLVEQSARVSIEISDQKATIRMGGEGQ